MIDGYKGQDVPNDVIRVRFHPSVINVDSEAFGWCKQLTEVILNDGLKEIGNLAFYSCTSLESVTIPSTVLEINQQAFLGCISLREVVVSDGLKKIGQFAFQNCRALQSITIPSTVVEIEKYAYMNCSSLRAVVLSESLQKIPNMAFSTCSSLTSITLPSTINEIGKFAFWDCSRLREVVVHNEGVQIGETSFGGCTSLQRIKFPSLLNRLNNIIEAGQRDIEAKMDDIAAVEWRDGELVVPTVSREMENQWGRMDTLVEVDKEKLDKVIRLIRHYEIKEATTLFELALWKAKISQVVLDYIEPANRDACRIEVPGPVKDTILQYLR